MSEKEEEIRQITNSLQELTEKYCILEQKDKELEKKIRSVEELLKEKEKELEDHVLLHEQHGQQKDKHVEDLLKREEALKSRINEPFIQWSVTRDRDS